MCVEEIAWNVAVTAQQLLQLLPGGASSRKLRLFACQCARIGLFYPDDRHWGNIVDAAEAFAEGQADTGTVATARDLIAVECDTLADTDQCLAEVIRAALDLDPHQAATEALRWLTAFEGEIGCGEADYAQGWLRDIFGNPFRPIDFAPWRTDTARALAQEMYESRDFSAMPILADALQDAGCDNDEVLMHCRDAHATHVRGCWVVDGVLGKQ